MVIDWKTQYCKDVNNIQNDWQIQCNPCQNHKVKKFFCGTWQAGSKIYLEVQRVLNIQYSHKDNKIYIKQWYLKYFCGTDADTINRPMKQKRAQKHRPSI